MDQKCQCKLFLGNKYHLCIGTSEKVEVYDSESSHFLQRFSLHSSKIDALIELPAEIKQSTKNKAHKNRVKYETHFSINSISYTTKKPFQAASFSLINKKLWIRDILAMYQQNPCYKISIDDQHGRYLAEHLDIGDQNSEQRVKLLIWTGKEKACWTMARSMMTCGECQSLTMTCHDDKGSHYSWLLLNWMCCYCPVGWEVTGLVVDGIKRVLYDYSNMSSFKH